MSAETTMKLFPLDMEAFISGDPRARPDAGLLCFANALSYTAKASNHSGSCPIKPGSPMLTLASREPSQTLSICSPTSVRIASKFLIPSRLSIWMMIAACLLTFSWRDSEGLIPRSDMPGSNRAGGAERCPRILAPYFAARTMWRACSTVST
jgi:hypothetical protein